MGRYPGAGAAEERRGLGIRKGRRNWSPVSIFAVEDAFDLEIELIDRTAYGVFFLSFTVTFAVEGGAIGGLVGMLVTVAFLALRRHQNPEKRPT